MIRLLFLALSLFVLAAPVAAQTDPRIALIMGNGEYVSVGTLDNTVPDATLMAQTLEEHGFQVSLVLNASQVEMNRAISQFGQDLRAGGEDATGLFYYAGHAVQSFGTNFLLPVDASLTNAADLSLVAVQADAVLRQMQSARNKTNIVVLDACRNNPFANIRNMDDNGLAEMNAPTGTFLSYSTAPNSVALDGDDGNSPFTKALLREIPMPGVPIEQTFKKVRIAVIADTAGQQTPWDTTSLTGEFIFAPDIPLTDEQLQEQQLWSSVRGSDDPVQLLLFLRGYPDGLYQEEARALLNTLMAGELTGPAVTPAPVTPTTQTGPTVQEQDMIAVAQKTGAAADYQDYLDEFPQGIYAELAGFELDALAQQAAASAAEPAPAAPSTPPEDAVALNRSLVAQSGNDVLGLTYDTPFPLGGPPIEGRTIADIVTLSPLFPPIEGLPEAFWKNETCASCHAWTKETLCTQGSTYAAATDDRAVSKQHPFGGIFKRGLKSWAAVDCP